MDNNIKRNPGRPNKLETVPDAKEINTYLLGRDLKYIKRCEKIADACYAMALRNPMLNRRELQLAATIYIKLLDQSGAKPRTPLVSVTQNNSHTSDNRSVIAAQRDFLALAQQAQAARKQVAAGAVIPELNSD